MDKNKKNVGGKLHFDVVLGNPPYQEEDGGASASAQPVYQHFVKAIKKLQPEYMCLITPSRWFVGGKGLDSFRKEMLHDPHLRILHDYLTPQDVFPQTNIRGGVSYFLWDKNYNNQEDLVRVVTHKHKNVIADVKRPLQLAGVDIFIRDSMGAGIVAKLLNILHKDNLSLHISARKPFGLPSNFDAKFNFHLHSDGLKSPLKCYARGGCVGYVARDLIKTHVEWIDTWKVLTTRANNIGTELADDNLNTVLCEPRAICTETYLVIGGDLSLTLEDAQRLQKYLQTKFVRYLHSLMKGSQDATAKTYAFVPMIDFKAQDIIPWEKSVPEINHRLYKLFGLTEDEAQHIERSIKEMV